MIAKNNIFERFEAQIVKHFSSLADTKNKIKKSRTFAQNYNDEFHYCS